MADLVAVKRLKQYLRFRDQNSSVIPKWTLIACVAFGFGLLSSNLPSLETAAALLASILVPFLGDWGVFNYSQQMERTRKMMEKVACFDCERAYTWRTALEQDFKCDCGRSLEFGKEGKNRFRVFSDEEEVSRELSSLVEGFVDDYVELHREYPNAGMDQNPAIEAVTSEFYRRITSRRSRK